ncbi:SMP-30/gluconolactonase/LRE family protein [Sorangium sp. So ce131]|uniref:SMP-30/gluconolactonase/LRE family protein n=1 Tax=Sorangium sp. So ce131 TaxID=3133282 RepID=UPI003F61C8C9
MKTRSSLVLWGILCAAANGCGDGGEPLPPEGGGGSSTGAGAGGPSSSTGDVAATTTSGTTSAGGGAGDPGGNGGGGGDGTGAGGGGDGGSSVCPGGPYAADPLPANGRAQLVQGGFDYVEGPVWVAELGALLFSEIHLEMENQPPLNGPRATIHKLTPPGAIEVFIEGSSTNGLGIDGDGGLIACTHDTRSVSVFDLVTKQRRPVAERYMNKRFNSPNDVVARSDGNVYFTDPDFQLSGTSELPMAVYRVSPSGEVNVVDTLESPNGIALSPDEGVLYVDDYYGGRIRKYTLSPDGSTGPSSELAANLSRADGMGVDCAGNLYVAWRNGVEIVAPNGERLGTIAGVGSASNVAFGGADRKTLYITAGGSLYSIGMNIPGYPY